MVHKSGNISSIGIGSKKCMQGGIDVTCMHVSFGGRGPSGFGDWLPFKNGQISLLGHGL